MRGKILSNRDELWLYVEQLWDDGRRSFEDLRDAELYTITGMIMQQAKPRDRWDFIVEADKDDELPATLMNLLIGNTEDTPNDILEVIKKNATKQAKFRIDELFERRAELERYLEREDIAIAREEFVYV